MRGIRRSSTAANVAAACCAFLALVAVSAVAWTDGAWAQAESRSRVDSSAPVDSLAQAQTGQDDSAQVFTVAPIAVDVTAESAAAARSRAMADGQVEGFSRLIDRIVPAEDRTLVPTLGAAEVQDYVIAIEVIRERASDVRYVADLQVRFNRAAVRGLLQRSGVSFAETPSRPVLLVPLLDTGGTPLLWEDANLWAAAWQASPPRGGLVPLVLPYGDLADIQDLDVEQALAPDVDRLLALAERYGARDAVVAVARMQTDAGPLSVSVTRYGEDGQTPLGPINVAASPGLGQQAVLTEGVVRVAARLSDDWKQANLVRPGIETRVSVVVPILGTGQWADIRRKLESISILARRELTRFGRTEARLDLWVNGDERQLRTALAQRDLELVPLVEDLLLKRRNDPVPAAYSDTLLPVGGEPNLSPVSGTMPSPGPGTSPSATPGTPPGSSVGAPSETPRSIPAPAGGTSPARPRVN